MVATNLKSNTFEGGTNGTAITTANSGGASGDAFDAVPNGTGITVTYDNAWKLNGSLSGKIVQTSTGTGLFKYSWATGQSDISFFFGFKYTVAAGNLFGNLRPNTDGTGNGIGLNWLTSGKVYIRDEVAGVNSANSTGAMTAGNDYVAHFRYNSGNNGNSVLNIYPKGSSTVVATASLTIPTTFLAKFLQVGVGTASSGQTMNVDDIRVGYGDWVDRADLTNAAPTLARGTDGTRTYQAGSSVSMPVTATDTDGTVSSLTVACTARPSGAALPTISGTATGTGTSSAALTATATLGAVGTYEFTFTAVDNAGASSTVKYYFEMYPTVGSDTILRSDSDPTDWTVGGSAPDARTALTDGDANTYWETPPSASGSVAWIHLGPLGPTGITMTPSGLRNGSGTWSLNVQVYKADKTTKIYETNIASIGTTEADYSFTLDNTALAAVPLTTPADIGRTALWVRLAATIV